MLHRALMLRSYLQDEKKCVSAIDQLQFIAASCGQFSWDNEKAVRGEEGRGEGRETIRTKEVSGVWMGDSASAGPVAVADPLRDYVEALRKASHIANLNGEGCPRAELTDQWKGIPRCSMPSTSARSNQNGQPSYRVPTRVKKR